MIKFRSNCPLGRALDIVGDRWTLLVLRDIMAFRKTTFKELAQMPEAVATNILSDRLNRLVVEGFITKTKSETNKLVYHYHPTAKAVDLVPAIIMIKEWSEKYLFEQNEKPVQITVL